MPRLQRKSFDTPDQVRQFAHGRVEVIELDETAIGRIIYVSGWRCGDIRPYLTGDGATGAAAPRTGTRP